MKTTNELKLMLDLLNTRRQLIEAHAQILQFQHDSIGAEIEATRKTLGERDQGERDQEESES